MITVDFVNADDVVEKRLRLDENAEYMCLDNTMLGEYTIDVDSKCRVMHQDGCDIIVGDGDEPKVELVAGKLLVVAHTGVEVPSWDELKQDFV